MHDDSSPGRVIVLTGAAGVLGRAMAVALAEAGHRLVLCDFKADALGEVAAACGDAGRIAICTADLAAPEGAAVVERTAVEAFGQVDALVNNAALTGFAVWPNTAEQPNPWELDAEIVRRFFDINFFAQHALMHRLLPGMIQRGWGRVINITCSFSTMQRLCPYGTTKAALEAYTAATELRLVESGATGVSASTLNPGGPVETPELRAINPEQTYWVQADVMNAPLLWLVSSGSDGVPGARYIGARWTPGTRPDRATYYARGSMAWRGFGEAPR